jgi:glutamate--cysteine ligase
MTRLLEQVEQGRSPADDFADTVVARGIGGAVTAMANGVDP